MRLAIVGSSGFTHVGESLRRGAEQRHEVRFFDVGDAYAGTRAWRAVNWRLRGRRPARLDRFSESVADAIRAFRPEVVITTGMAPLNARATREVRSSGSVLLNFSTDDPWNGVHRAPWFLETLPTYDLVFTPRHANVDDFRRIGCRNVEYLPFGYDPQHCFPEALNDEQKRQLESDVLFVGGADRDRVPIVTALAREGFRLALYGLYWHRHRELRPFARGSVDAATIRRATRATRVAVCMVRRANRDGHVMRSFEIPATRACMVAEDTADHRTIFGRSGDAVEFFDGTLTLIARIRRLLESQAEREHLADRAYNRVTRGANSYRDRLDQMLARASRL